MLDTAPLNEAVEYEDFNFDNKFAHKTEFRGPPTEELEETWTEMWQSKFLGSMKYCVSL